MTTPTAAEVWSRLAREGRCGTLDRELATTLGRLGDERDPAVLAAIAVLHAHVMRGHACVRLGELTAAGLGGADELGRRLAASPLVSTTLAETPLVLDGDRLYLERHAAAERSIADWVRARVVRPSPLGTREDCRRAVARVFGEAGALDWQRVAAALALVRSFIVLAGGPGTGKTTTVVRVLASALEVTSAQGKPHPRMMLLAPTGKAAARLRESVQQAGQRLAGRLSPEVLQALPNEAATVHRALGRSVDGEVRRDRARPLDADWIVVDEASMIDVELLARLLDAVPEGGRLILLGDPHQLASVEVGAVLGDLCGLGVRPESELSTSLSAAVADEVSEIAGTSLPDASRAGAKGILADSLVVLTQVHRTAETGAVAELSRAIHVGDVEGAIELLHRAPHGLRWYDPTIVRLDAVVESVAVQHHRVCLQAAGPLERLQALERFRTLAAHREGAAGAQGLNELVEARLARAGVIGRQRPWYAGRPLMVLENDYELGLFNGDVGLVEDGRMVVFREGADAVRLVHAVRLPAHETAYALTIHKSQGSEFDEVLVVLPQGDSRILTRELVYTAVTRAKTSVALVATPEALRMAIERRIRRGSGLGELLWSTP